MIKTILHLIPTLEGGGAERQLAMLSTEQSKRGYEVHIGLRRAGINKQLLNDRIQVHYLGDYKIIDPRFFINILKLITAIKPDIMQTWLPQMDIAGGLSSIFKSIPWIMTERASSLAYKNIFFTSYVRFKLANYSKFIVANSKEGIRYYDRAFNRKKLKVIYNAVDVDSIVEKTSKASNNTNKTTYILSVGRLEYQKNHETLIEAISLLNFNQIKVDILGEGSMMAELQQLIIKKKMEHIIEIKKYNKDWWGLLKDSSMLISMSRFEGSPNVVLESMAGVCPLIVSDIVEHRELLSNNSALFVDVNDSKSLSEAIINIIYKKDEAKERANNAFCIIQKFDINTAANEYEKLYNHR